jgi:CRISPR-associated DxTHG motif protein
MSQPRKVFISFLGVTAYTESIYQHPQTTQNSGTVFYVQQALARLLTTDWEKNDVFYVCTTPEALKHNWKQRRPKSGDPTPDGLLYHLQQDFKGEIHNINIENGYNEIEIWQIFDAILAHIQLNDIIYLDITNSFRSIPTFATTLLNYAKLEKKIKIGGIFYGNWEAAKDGISPIIDVTNIEILQEFTAAVQSFIDTGSVAMLKKSITKLDEKLDEKIAEDLADRLEAFTLAIATVRGKELCYKLDIDKIKSRITALKNKNIDSRINNILDKIAEQIAPFKTQSTLNGFHAVAWCIKYNMVQGGYTFLQETLKSAALEAILGQNLNLILNPVARDTAATALYGNTEQEIISRVEKNNIKIPNDIKNKLPNLIAWVAAKNLKTPYWKLVKSPALRNDINHAGYNQRSSNSDVLIKDLKDIFTAIKTCLNI